MHLFNIFSRKFVKNGSKYSILGEKVPKPGPKRTNFRVGGEVWADKMAFGTDQGSIGIIGGPRMEYRPMGYFQFEVERMDLRPPRDHVLLRLWHYPRNATILPIRILVHTEAAWVRKASRVRSGDDFGCGIQFETRAANGNPFYCQQVRPS